MRISKISLVLAFCLPVFLFSCRKDNGSGKYIVKITTIGSGTNIEQILYKGKSRGHANPGDNEFPTVWTPKDTIEADGHLKIAAFVLSQKSSRIGVKIEVFKLGSDGKATKVGSVSKSAAKGFKAGEGEFGYGATIEFPSNKKEAINTVEKWNAVAEEL